MTGPESIGTPVLWFGFAAFVVGMLLLDVAVFHRQSRKIRVREALLWTRVWISFALLFNLGVYFWFGSERAREFLTAYLVEKALSLDNILVFAVVFSALAVRANLQHRVLIWGIFGALIMRGVLIVFGATLLDKFHWVSHLFGAFLVFTSAKMFVRRTVEANPDRNPLCRLFRRFIPLVDDYRGDHFTAVEGGKRYATPLLLVLVAIEATDIVFAIDSVPAIFAITKDPFIVYMSNIFAVLGLRALYFAVAGIMGKFHYLNIAFSLLFAFLGGKILLADVYAIPISASLSVIAAVLAGALVASLVRPARTAVPRFRSTSSATTELGR
jgi:tellurite resistance protein TerC